MVLGLLHALATAGLVAALSGTAVAAELKPKTVAAFDRYVSLVEARMAAELAADGRFLILDTDDEATRKAKLADLRAGRLVIERLEAREDGEHIHVPDGMVHHWVGLVFVPGGTAADAVALLKDYERHDQVFQPAVQRSRVLSQDGDTFRVYLRFFMKKVLAVTLNSDHDARFTTVSPRRAYSRVVSTRIQEVEHAGTAEELEKPVGRDGGYLWRINSYWRFDERDGGVYVHCESVSLSRGIPLGFGWLIGPFVTSIPRESLTFTLETTRKVLAAGVPIARRSRHRPGEPRAKARESGLGRSPKGGRFEAFMNSPG